MKSETQRNDYETLCKEYDTLKIKYESLRPELEARRAVVTVNVDRLLVEENVELRSHIQTSLDTCKLEAAFEKLLTANAALKRTVKPAQQNGGTAQRKERTSQRGLRKAQ